MNVGRFLLYTDNAVYQICTPTVKSHGPDKGTISVAAVPGSAHHFRGHASLSGSLCQWLFKFQCVERGKSLAEKMIFFCQKLEFEVQMNMTNMQKHASPLC